jgi:erythromycin esterase-like protein
VLSLQRDENGKGTESDDVSMVKYKYRIPRDADNVEVSLRTFNSKELFEDAYDVEILLEDACNDGNRFEGAYYYDGTQEDSARSAADAVKYGYAILFLNRFEIKINCKNIEDYIYNHQHPFAEEELKRISGKTADSISIDGKVKVVGIGETVHGCTAFSRQEGEIVKHLIKNGFNRIGLETTPLLGMQINDYVNGRPVDLDSILAQGIFNYLNNKETKALFDYIKTYNQRTDRKISVFGFDIHIDNSIEAIEALARDGTAIQDSLYAGYLLNFIEKYGKGYKCGNSRNILLRIRDKIMSENIMYITDRAAVGDKIVLMAHFGHLAGRKLPRPSAGGYLSERYGEEYAVIGLFVGEGTYHTRHIHGFDSVARADKYPLSKPIGKSLEQLCSLMDKKEFYMNEVGSQGLLDKVLYGRSAGSRYDVMQFEPIDLRKELDVVWFTRESSGEQ